MVVYLDPLATVFLKTMSRIPYQCNLKVQISLNILECVNITITLKKITPTVSTSLGWFGCSVRLESAYNFIKSVYIQAHNFLDDRNIVFKINEVFCASSYKLLQYIWE